MERANSLREKKEKTELRFTQSIEFSQASVASTFSDGSSIKDLTTKLLSGTADPSIIPPIRIVQYRNKWFTLDNRRLRAFKDAFVLKIPVIICNLFDDDIKKEFFAKKTNKSITDGGVIRIFHENSNQHFEEGAFVFTKRVLNWTFEQLSMPFEGIKYCQPLPAQFSSSDSYYKGFLDLILEEARASLQAGLEASEKNTTSVSEFTLHSIKKAKKTQNPSIIVFSKRVEDKVIIKPNDAYLLEYGLNKSPNSLRLLALASYVPSEDSNRVSFKVVFDEEQISVVPEAFVKQVKWKAKSIGSLVTHLRMFDVCMAAPNVPWLSELLTGNLKNQSKSETALVLAPQYTPTLNNSQKEAIKKFLDLEQGIQLVQGPPGTGKTTMISTLLKLLIPQGRVLVCAPSNKAVHVLADRFLSEYPDIPAMLIGVEDKLPKDHNRLQEIFAHTWGSLKLELINGLKAKLWTLLPADVFANTQEIKTNVEKVCTKIEKIQEDFLNLANSFKKYSLPILQKETVDQFVSAVKQYIQFISNNENFRSALLTFIGKEKTIDITKKAFLESNLVSFFNKIKILLAEVTQILTKVEVDLQKMENDESNTGLEMTLLNHSHIIFSTLSVSGRKSLKELREIEILIIDEAGQALEAESLIPLVTQPKKCLLVGDTKQLPATVLSQDALKLNFERSMMWRLIEQCGQIPVTLKIQYRMHPEIRHWPSLMYYDNKLQDGSSLLQRQITHLIKDVPAFLAPYAFINVSGKEVSNGKSFENLEETLFIIKIINHFQTKFQINAASQIGVITFYKGQATLIQKYLQNTNPNVKVQTVDSFQGDENDIIIISFVRANSFGNIGFIKDFRRLNVALTRAKHALTIVGDASTLEKGNSDVGFLIKDAKERKCFFDQAMVEKQLEEVPKKIDPPVKNISTCLFFNGKPNSCRKGNKCNFSHVKTEQSFNKNNQSKQTNLSTPKKYVLKK